MSDETLATGAYVIRNKGTSKVLHISKDDVAAVMDSSIVLHNRDEIKYREKQIWWVERLPENEDEDVAVYSITSTTGLSLDVGGEGTHKGASIMAFLSHGGYNQRWRFLGGQDAAGENERVIVDVGSGFVLDITDSGNSCHIWEHLPKAPKQFWEFLKPVVAIPPGWVEIVNVGSGEILSQTYLSSPPQLVRPPEQDSNLQLPMYRETWGTQWALILPTAQIPHGCDSNGTWIIKNRLTGGRLRYSTHPYKGGHQLSVVAVLNQGAPWVGPRERWILELYQDNTWKLQNQESSFYLERTEVHIKTGRELACVDQSFKKQDTHKMWSLRKVSDHDHDAPLSLVKLPRLSEGQAP